VLPCEHVGDFEKSRGCGAAEFDRGREAVIFLVMANPYRRRRRNAVALAGIYGRIPTRIYLALTLMTLPLLAEPFCVHREQPRSGHCGR
jgi:hypothetical protein